MAVLTSTPRPATEANADAAAGQALTRAAGANQASIVRALEATKQE